jgi:catechol 2,3-dioxygenase-like lactoylglutathione lyase family enzyme
MLADQSLVAFVATTDAERARRFYGEVLGLQLVGEGPYALVFDAHGTMLRAQIVQNVQPPPYTVLGWRVGDIAEAIRGLTGRGVQFERFPGLQQDDLGIWTTPDGSRVAWFKDPEGHILSLTQFV